MIKKKKFNELWLCATISTEIAFHASENPELQAAWFKQLPVKILIELENYHKKQYLFDNKSVNQFLNTENNFQFWSLIATSRSELDLRNRLDPNKVLKISQIHGFIAYTHQVAKAKMIKEKYLSNIVISPNNETESLSYEELEIQESQELSDLHETIDIWIESLEYENLSELTTEHYFDIDTNLEYNEFVEILFILCMIQLLNRNWLNCL
ncbi:147_t:CDS:2 [Racocetra persica]|uniref:147_t:CDS:1 n=1 Tax=Racocetra persica TaxID=160502 RepID=A0ACA9KSG4_9GLOM|nr:147_t:CDS:2 [Racocetra persica]